MKKYMYMALGWLSTALGFVGVFLPLLPTVPFFLLAGFCFGRSSESLKLWLQSTSVYQKHMESYVNGEGMTRETKVKTMILVSLLLGVGFASMGAVPVGRLCLLLVWLGHLIYFLVLVKTKSEE